MDNINKILLDLKLDFCKMTKFLIYVYENSKLFLLDPDVYYQIHLLYGNQEIIFLNNHSEENKITLFTLLNIDN